MLAYLILLSASAVQEKPAPKPAEQIVVTGERQDDQKRVCKQVEEIGSIIPRRTCRSKGEWTAMARQNERRTRDYINDKNAMSGRIDPDEKGGL